MIPHHPSDMPPAMPLVDYPDSGSDDDSGGVDSNSAPTAQSAQSGLKRKHSHSANAIAALPPLPSAFHDLYASNARISTSDNPSLHGGRKRAVPHVEGNWPSHVYLECKVYFFCMPGRLHDVLTRSRDTYTG